MYGKFRCAAYVRRIGYLNTASCYSNANSCYKSNRLVVSLDITGANVSRITLRGFRILSNNRVSEGSKTKSNMYQAPNIRTPTLEEIENIAKSQKLGIDKEKLVEYHDMVCDMISKSFTALEKYTEPKELIKYPRTPGYRPKPEDNKYNAWYYKTDIQGATSGPLKGYKVVMKDNFPVAGVPMMIGSRVFEGFVPDYDATVVTRVLDAGGNIVGKAVCENMTSGGNSFTSCPLPVLNPHDPTRSSGGSSSGCAVLLQQKEADLAIGNDAGGSIRMPAAWTGVVGLKPTQGLVPCTGLPQFWSSAVEVCGPMARTVKDCALLLEVLAGDDEGRDARQINIPKVEDIPKYSQLLSDDLSGYKIGIVKEGFLDCEEDVARIVREAAEKLTQKGATVEEVSVPIHDDVGHFFLPAAVLGFYKMTLQNDGFGISASNTYPTSLMASFTSLLRNRRGDLPVAAKASCLAGQYIDDNYGLSFYGKSQNLMRLAQEEYNKVLKTYDALIMPTIKYKAPKLPTGDMPVVEYIKTAKSMTKNTLVFNATKHPSLSINAGFSEGLPVGMMINGRLMEEQKVLNVAYAWEKIRDGGRQ